MKTLVASLVLVALATLLAAEAGAQVTATMAPAPPYGFAPSTYTPAALAPTAFERNATAPEGYVFPYSYYAAPYPIPARVYVGYGSNDFPFYGRAYGHPYDLWTWPYLTGSYQRDLAHYYYPVLK